MTEAQFLLPDGSSWSVLSQLQSRYTKRRAVGDNETYPFGNVGNLTI